MQAQVGDCVKKKKLLIYMNVEGLRRISKITNFLNPNSGFTGLSVLWLVVEYAKFYHFLFYLIIRVSNKSSQSSKIFFRYMNFLGVRSQKQKRVKLFLCIRRGFAFDRLRIINSQFHKDPLSSTHQFHAKGPRLFSLQNPSVQHQKPLSSTLSFWCEPEEFGRRERSGSFVWNWFVELRGTQYQIKVINNDIFFEPSQ